jgi:L-iditol 2-dehydrogenase
VKTSSGYLRAPWEFELREVKLPDAPAENEVLVRVEACGICGTDLRAAVMAKEGQAVALESSSYCGSCAQCRNGRVDLCNKAPNFWKNAAMGFSGHMLQV